jgi:hypothetical protein
VDLLIDSLHHLDRFAPKSGVELFDVSEAKDGHEMLAEEFVFITFHNDEAVAEEVPQEIAELLRLLIFVGLGNEDFLKCLVAGRHETIAVEEGAKVQQAVVGNRRHPFEKSGAVGPLEDDQAMAEEWKTVSLRIVSDGRQNA